MVGAVASPTSLLRWPQRRGTTEENMAILMQSDLQSVEKKDNSVLSHEPLPPKRWKLVPPRLRMSRSFLPRCIQSCFPLLQGPSCRKSPSALFRSKWVKYDCKPRSDRKRRSNWVKFDYNPRSDRKMRIFRSGRGL